MEKYGEFTLINKLAKDFNYTHDQAFDLSWREAYTIIALSREEAYIEGKASELYQKSQK